MSNYKNGKIYKIISKNTDMIYIGSTTKVKLTTRLSEHRHSFNHNGSMSSRNMFLWDDAEIKLIENYPCESKIELRKREQYYLDLYPDYIVNDERKAYIDKKEYNRNYMKQRREEGSLKPIDKSYYREWYEKNRERELEKAKQRRQDYAAEKAESNRKYRQSENGKEKRRVNDKLKRLCEYCDKLISKGNFHTHRKTKLHMENVRLAETR
jgi:hypothetical protein